MAYVACHDTQFHSGAISVMARFCIRARMARAYEGMQRDMWRACGQDRDDTGEDRMHACAIERIAGGSRNTSDGPPYCEASWRRRENVKDAARTFLRTCASRCCGSRRYGNRRKTFRRPRPAACRGANDVLRHASPRKKRRRQGRRCRMIQSRRNAARREGIAPIPRRQRSALRHALIRSRARSSRLRARPW